METNSAADFEEEDEEEPEFSEKQVVGLMSLTINHPSDLMVCFRKVIIRKEAAVRSPSPIKRW